MGEMRLEASGSATRTAVYMYSATTTPGEPGVTLQLREPEEEEEKAAAAAAGLGSVLARIRQEESGALSITYHHPTDIETSIDVLLSSNPLSASNGTTSRSGFDLFDSESGLSPPAAPPDHFPNDNSTSPAISNPDDTESTEEEKSSGGENSKLTVKKPRSKANSPNRQGPQQCQICGKVFGNASALAKHKLTHSDERKYVCTMCGKAFKRQDHLNGHMLTHRNKKPYECRAEGCGKSYCDARSLRRHTENHHSGLQLPSSTTVSPSTTPPKEEETQTCIQYAPPPQPPAPQSSVSHLQKLLASETPSCPPHSGSGHSNGGNNNESLTKQQLDLIHQIMQQTQTTTPTPTTVAKTITTPSPTVKHGKNWTSQAPQCLVKTNTSSTKPVECNLCHRKFKNIPALNGHMRLHGGYFKKDSDSRKCEKKELTGPPLQTASVSVRALIEEKIIQKRTNPTQTATTNTQPSGVPPPVPSPDKIDSPLPKVAVFTTSLRNATPTANNQPCLDHPLLKRSPKPSVKRASSDPGLLQTTFCDSSQQLQLSLPPEPSYSLGVYTDDAGYLSPPLPDDVLEQVQSVQESMLLQGVDPAQLAESIQAATLQDIASLEDYTSPTPSPQSYQHHQDIQSVLDSPLPVGLADFAYAHSQQNNVGDANGPHSDPNGTTYVPSPLPSPSFTYPTPPASQEGQSPSFPPLQSSLSHGNVTSPLSSSFYTSPMSSSAAVEAALNEVLPQHNYPSPPPQSPLSNTPVPSPLSLPPTSTSPIPSHHALQSQMMPNSEDPLLSSSPRDFGSRKRFDFQAFKVLSNGTIDFGTAGAQGVTGIVLDRNGELKLIQTSCFQSLKTGVLNGATLFVNTKPKIDSMLITDDLKSTKSASSPVVAPTLKSNKLKTKIDEVDDIFLNPNLPSSPVKTIKRPRLETTTFPQQKFNSRLRRHIRCSGTNRTLLYTPQPMLQPTRLGSGLFCQTTAWHSSTNHRGPGNDDAIDAPSELEGAVESDVAPHINIGPQYQCDVPSCSSWVSDQETVLNDQLLWDCNLLDESSEGKVDNYLDFACSAALPGGGRNKEYALHLLQLSEGKIEESMLKLMQPTSSLPPGHPLLSFDYLDSERWTSNEMEAFQHALWKFDKDFLAISQEIGSKSVKQCVQFYYMWKKICPEEYKRLRATCDPETVAINCEKSFSCENRDCSASFSTKAALVAHEKLHNAGASASSHSNQDRRSSASNQNNFSSTEQVGEFPCKICGKIFNKVKSRSAHMKSHRPPDAEPRKSKQEPKGDSGDQSSSRSNPVTSTNACPKNSSV